MSKRPSLAETMRQVAVTPDPQPVKVAKPRVVEEPAPPPAPRPPYFAATRVGKKKVTVALSPAAHKQLKSLAVELETKSETLLAEAIRDLFTKHGKSAID